MKKKAKTKLKWVPFIIPGCIDKYSICENGDIKNGKGIIKQTHINGNGYLYTQIYDKDNRNKITIAVHRLLAVHFIPKTEDDIEKKRTIVHFKDFDKTNITLSNLEWVNIIELTIKTAIHYNPPRSNRDYAEYICKLLCKGYTESEICSVLDLDLKNYSILIRRISKRQIYKDISSKYSF